MSYDDLFAEYFNMDDNIDIEYRGLPIKPADNKKWIEGNCPGDPPKNDPSCKEWFCNTSIRKWQCKTN